MNGESLFLYAKDAARLAAFYAEVAGLRLLRQEPTITLLQSPGGMRLLVHAIPEAIARDILIASPPERREEAALKFVLRVPSLRAAAITAERLGGRLFADECWDDAGLRIGNAMDPEGNVFQLCETLAAAPRIRPEREGEELAIAALVEAAFGADPGRSAGAAGIVSELRGAGVLTLSLVALHEGQIAGHLAACPVRVAGRDLGWFGLGPLSVLPELQARGFGSALIDASLDALRRLGAAGCMVVGEPGYYGRWGFKPLPGLSCPGVEPAYFLALPFGDEATPQGELA